MNRRRLLGISCALVALALSLVPAAPSAHAQLPPPPLPGVNLAPVVIAGLDQVITLPGSATLTGAAIDDGLPIPPVLTTTWSKVSGPGTVSFSNPGALISTATFSESGAYVLRLTASDGALAAIDDMAVTVNPAVPPITEKIDPALLALMAADPQKLLPVIVEMQHPLPPFLGQANVSRALEALDLLRLYGIPVAELSLIDGAAGFANAAGISALSLAPTVAFIHHDATVGPRPSAEPPEVAPPDQISGAYGRVVKAHRVWELGIAGRGVTVAILDSGVAADADLIEPENRILASVNFADQRLASDPGGHGTHIAGIVAGNGNRSDGEFTGVAPQANVVDVRVLGTTGSGRISSVVRGIEWVLAHRSVYNIRVINLSFGAPAPASYRADPFSAAVEIAWRRGLVVVAAAGNGGPGRDSVVTARQYGWQGANGLPDPIADGSGLLDAKAAEQTTAVPAANAALRPADGFARALYPVLYGSPLRWKDPTLGGVLWNLLSWDTLVWNSVAWDNFNWDSVAWDSVAWDSVAWDSVAWDSVAWDSVAWDSVAWDSYTLDSYTLD